MQGFGGENLKKRYHLEDLVAHGRIILKCTRILKKKKGKWGTGFTSFRMRSNGGLL
jgi:hypothetical protein